MKNIQLKPLGQRIIKPYGMENPLLGLKWVGDAKNFYAAHPTGSQLTPGQLDESVAELFPHWLTDEDGNAVEIQRPEAVKRLNLGGGNKNFGEPRLQLYWDRRSKSYFVIDALELVDQLNLQQEIARTAENQLGRIESALQMASAQMKIELSPELQQAVLEQYEQDRKGVELTKAWASEKISTLQDAVQATLGNGGDNGSESRLAISDQK